MGLLLPGALSAIFYHNPVAKALHSVFAPNGTALLTSTLLGRLAQHDITYSSEQQVEVQTSWNAEVQTLVKVNAITAQGDWLVVGGISKEGKGIVEVWRHSESEGPAEQLSQLSL